MRPFTIILHPLGKKVFLKKPTTITNAAAKVGINLLGPCGGKGRCGKCKVKIVKFPNDIYIPPDPVSKELLNEIDLKNGFRLACTTKTKKDLELELPTWSWVREEEYSKHTQEILSKGSIAPEIEKRFPVDANIRLLFCPLPKPSLDDNISDLERMKRCISKDLSLKNNEIKISKAVIQNLTKILRDNDWNVHTVFSLDGPNPEMLAALPSILKNDKNQDGTSIYGVAIDIGTTTIVAYLLNLITGEVLAVASKLNPQVRIGADVISRIKYAMQNPEGNQVLYQMLTDSINSLIQQLCIDYHIDSQYIFEVVAVGNTTMLQNFLGLPVNHLGTAPYIPVSNGDYYTKASEFDLNINPGGKIYIGPIVTGFFGADAVGNALVTNMLSESPDDSSEGQVKLVIDVGTNSELLLSDQNRLIACSAAAGPAFEGGNLQFGVRACPGAIHSIQVSRGHVRYSTIDGKRACGITGSGIVEGISEFLHVGAIEDSGSIDKDTEKRWLKYPKRIKLKHAQEPTYYCNVILPELKIVPKEKSALDTAITITQHDIQQIQLAKAAIRTGIDILLNELGVSYNDLDRIYLSGAFGNYLKPRSAIEINLLPNIELEKIKTIGNAAGSSAKLLLRSRAARVAMRKIANKIEYVDLATYREFQDMFVENMQF